MAKARGLFKSSSKMAAALKPADELSIALAGTRGTKTLAGVRTTRSHEHWRSDLNRLSLVWFMTECAFVGSGPPQLNSHIYQLTANLLRSKPEGEETYSTAAVFAIRLLTLHGLMADLDRSLVDQSVLEPGQPAFLLPSGEGLIDLANYNRQYARGRAGLLKLSAVRLARWKLLQRRPLIDYAAARADLIDVAILCTLLTQHLGNLGNHPVGTMKFLKKQWKLPSIAQLIRGDG